MPNNDSLDAPSPHSVENLESRLRRRQVYGARLTAIETLLVLQHFIARAKFVTVDELVDMLKDVGRRLQRAQPKERTVGNVVLKVIHIIREEYGAVTSSRSQLQSPPENQPFSLSSFVLLGQPRRHRAPKTIELRSLASSNSEELAKTIKPMIMEALQDVQYELETVYENVAKNARDHVHSDEIILTLGQSRTVETFIKMAAHHRKFTVIVLESAPTYSGHNTARSLSSMGISTLLLPDSATYALMPHVSKVILPAHAVLATGGLFAVSGASLVAHAARAHSTPVIVCTGQFKMTPLWNVLGRGYGALELGDPSKVLCFDEGELLSMVEVVNPQYDYVEPELVNAFVTNDGDHPPSSIHRLIKEAYGDDEL